jgi:hypothetical protein
MQVSVVCVPMWLTRHHWSSHKKPGPVIPVSFLHDSRLATDGQTEDPFHYTSTYAHFRTIPLQLYLNKYHLHEAQMSNSRYGIDLLDSVKPYSKLKLCHFL